MSIWTGSGLGLVLLVLLYCTPLLVAWVRKHHNADAIGVLNLLLGWTVIGWVGSLVWALTSVRAKEPPAAQPTVAEPDTKLCPLCAERIMAAAKLCKHCGSKLDSPAP